ncbi:sugar nucleotide-binding protein [Robertkochia solimangrovi]|uniref:sugar nucleotide-binding protein n=1 Tax=Robertkochia solimangrovi TaxID=2213046 RepID=UPI0011816610|nr:sugar nucleotide-binding protein [Robertkochia solimangrovi]TRZ42904.1 dTDP-4-dehydrorhamnose reductase [Robertkochia solimangrovi]
MNRILILGASGFIGGALYKELCNYFDTYGTYHTGRIYSGNKHFFHFDMETDDVFSLLIKLRPNLIISSLRGDFDAQVETHELIAEYCKATGAKVIFLSSANVFDAFSNYPSYEYDKTLSESPYGKLKIRIENMFMRLPEKQFTIVRLPMVFGSKSPRIKELRYFLENKEAYEVFPDLVMNVTNVDMLTRQIHYIINRKRRGIFHLGSSDLVHHDEFIFEACLKMGYEHPLFKNVYTSNFDRFLAVLPKDNKLPKHLQFTQSDIIEAL